MSKPKPKKYLESIKPYKGGVSKVDGIDKIFKLSSNENPFGASLLAIEEYKKVSAELGVYPDSSNLMLREMISKKYSLEIDRIICGCGSDEILHLLAKTYLNEGQEGLISENAFAVYPLAISTSGAKVIRAKEKNFKPMVDNIISSVTKDTRIIYLANPNNPTGTLLKYEELEKLHTSIPSDILLVIDAAYSEYVTDKDYSVGFELAKDYENIVITKTFSKVFGLAGLRIGWAYCPVDISKTLSTLKVPFSVNVAAQKAAIQALKDDNFINSSVEHNSKWINILEENLSEMGLKVYPSQCNFLLVEFSPEVKISAPEAYDILCSKGLIVREMQEYNLPNCLRITIGTEEANLLLMDNLKDMVN